MTRLWILALFLLSLAAAQIAAPAERFYQALGKPQAGPEFTLNGAKVKAEVLDGLLYRVHYEGPVRDTNTPALVVAAAFGDMSEKGIYKPFKDWLEQNLPALKAVGRRVKVNLGPAFVLEIEADDETLRFTLAPAEVPEDAFGEPRHVLGEKGVMIREYSDFYCPFCQKLALEVLPEIKKKLVEPGKARFEYRHFPLIEIHPDAFQAAEASECAAEQGKFWPYHDLLFATLAKQKGKGVDYVALAKELGLDTEKFSTCLETGKYKDVVRAMRAEAEALGLQGTPSVFVGPFVLPNPFDLESYENYLRLAEAKAKQD